MQTKPKMAARHGERFCIFVILASTTNERSLRAGGLQYPLYNGKVEGWDQGVRFGLGSR